MLMLTSMFSSAFITQPVKAEPGTIYIRADGEIDPPTAPIQRDGDLYTFTANIYDSLVVQKNNIAIDGIGCTLQATGSRGMDLSNRNNVTVRNVRISTEQLSWTGIFLNYSSYITVVGNSITGEGHSWLACDGIDVRHSSHITIVENHITNSSLGIQFLDSSDYNVVSGNNIENSGRGIYLYESSHNRLQANHIANCDEVGICIEYSSHNTVSGNNIDNLLGRDIAWGINLYSSANSTVSGNNIANNEVGIYLYSASSNTVSRNNIANNDWGIVLLAPYQYPSSDNLIYHNNFIENSLQVEDWGSSGVSFWDDGYPSGGNYWSDYEERYPEAEELNDSGIWNTPYIVNENNQDNYPLTEPWTLTSPWPMFQHDAQHTGRSPYVGPSANPQAEIFLGNQTVNEFFGSPIIDSEGTLYFGKVFIGGDGGLCAHHPNSVQKWFCEIPPAGSSASLLNPPALFEPAKTVYAHSDSEIFAVNTENGSLKWNRSFASIYGYLVVADSGVLYFTALQHLPDDSYRTRLIGLGENGVEVLSYDIGESGPEPSSPTIGGGGTIYIGYNDTLFALNPNGTEKWRRTFEADIKYHPPRPPTVTTPTIADDGTIYLVVRCESDWRSPTDQGWTNILHAIDPEDPTEDRWTRSLRSNWPQNPVIDFDGNVYVTNNYYGVGGGGRITLVAYTPQGDVKASQDFIEHGIPCLPLIDAENTVYALRRSVHGSATLNVFGSEGGQTSINLPFQEGHRQPLLSLGSDGALYIGGHKNLYVIKSSATPPPPTFKIGDWVRTTANLNVREGPGLGYGVIDTMPEGALGQIMGGSVEADGYVWWDVNYDMGIRGWSAENWLGLAPPNQLPVALFNYYPVEPEAGEQVTFDASASCDPDGTVVFYEWDWNGDGDYDDYTTSPTITFLWIEEGLYNVTLKVIDDKGTLNVTSKEVTISSSSTSETVIVLASIWDYFMYNWDDVAAINQIDRWIRGGEGQPFDWLKPYEKADLIHLLNKEIDSDQAPRLTYKTFARSKISEEELMHEAFRFYISPSAHVMKKVFKHVFDSVWKFGISISIAGVTALNPIVGAGLRTIYLAYQMHSLRQIFSKINKENYITALAEYILSRGNFYESPETAWEAASASVDRAISARAVPLAEGERREKIREETWSYFEELWREYGDEGDFGVGLSEDFQQENKNKLKNLLLSALKDPYGGELVSRKVAHVASPVELRVYDSEGGLTGVINGEEKAEIPYSVYDIETDTATIFLANDSLKYDVAGISAGTYTLEITSIENGQIINFTAANIQISTAAIHQYTIDWVALSQDEDGVTVMVDSDGDGSFEHTFVSDNELTQSEYVIGTDDASPQTWLNIGEPKYIVSDLTCLTSATSIELIAEDNPGGSGVASSAYTIYNATYDSGWTIYTESFYLIGLGDGTYQIDYNSTDIAGNVELSNTVTVILDNAGPSLTVENPPAEWALQDGVTFMISAIDASGTSSMNVSIREADDGDGTPVGFEDLPVIYDAVTGRWTLFFDTLQLPDGYYVIILEAKDNLGHTSSTTISYSIRNWAVLELLPASKNNKAGRTMPTKFALRVAASVDPRYTPQRTQVTFCRHRHSETPHETTA